jgi:hypothetical protein
MYCELSSSILFGFSKKARNIPKNNPKNEKPSRHSSKPNAWEEASDKDTLFGGKGTKKDSLSIEREPCISHFQAGRGG